MKKTLGIITLSLLTLPVVTLAVADITKPVFTTVDGLMQFINDKVINWIFTGLIVTAVIFILLAAFDFLTSGGDATKVSNAQKKLLYAVIAIVVGALAKGLVLMVGNLLGVNVNF